jgi:hypothetical protein
MVTLLATLVPTAPALAWVDHTQSVAAVKAETAPPPDASLSDPIWQKALVLKDFYDYTNRGPAKLSTVAYILYDAKNMYVGVHAQQAGVAITATQNVDHAGVATDDHVSFNIDTAGNGDRVYQFRANPKGVHDEYSSENARYAPEWTSLSKIFPNGDYNVLYIIPLSVIRSQGASPQRWKMDVVRFVAATNDEYTWAYDSTMNSVGSSQFWPFVTDIAIATQATRPRPHADFYGLASGAADHSQFQNGIGNFQDTKARSVGLDLTVPFTNTLAFVGTLSPDFSNVEQDQTTIAPQEFQRNYNEYRPFFAQGANFINSLPGININSFETMFYTPSIGIFNHGEKIEGTLQNSSVGLLNVNGVGFNDEALGYKFGKTDNSLNISFEGVRANHPGIQDTATGFGIGTTNPHSGAFGVVKYSSDRGTLISAPGQADNLQFATGLQNANVQAFALYKDIGPQYNPVDGYVQISDIRGPQTFMQYTGVGNKNSLIKSYTVYGGGDRFVDRSGAAHEADVFSGINLTTTRLLSFGYGQSTSELRFYDAPFPFYANGQNVEFNQQQVSAGYKDGTPAPVDVSYSWGPFGGVFLQQLLSSTARQFGKYSLSMEYDGTVEHAKPGDALPALDTQWLRRASLSRSFGKDASIAIGVRNINGNGGYGVPGTNLAISYHARFRNLDELYFDFGTPAANTTLHRVILKYIFHVGGGTGT